VNYDTIKQTAKELGCKVKDLIALSQQNDPFYMGAPADVTKAEWFAELWEQFGYTNGVHLRRIHYRLISQQRPFFMHNGLPYENTNNCWAHLTVASKAARYLELVPPSTFVDRRNPTPIREHGKSA